MPQADENLPRRALGAMTGTSIDGIDAVRVRAAGRGLGLRAAVERHVAAPLDALAPRLRRLAEGEPASARDFAEAARDLGLRHAELLASLLDDGEPPCCAVVHGQTILHAPPLTWQLIDPEPIVAALGLPVLHDLRRADVASGGQGAPITPLADRALYGTAPHRRAVVNIGGFVNATILPAEPAGADPETIVAAIRGFDVCAGNHVLDGVARRALGTAYDDGGRAAASGRPDPAASAALREALAAQARAGRSLGTGDEAAAWIAGHATRLAPGDLAATAVHALAATIAERVAPIDEVILAGGGARNLALVAALEVAFAPTPVRSSAALGVPVEAREAAGMAVLGLLALDGVIYTLPAVTHRGAASRPGGAWSGSIAAR